MLCIQLGIQMYNISKNNKMKHKHMIECKRMKIDTSF